MLCYVDLFSCETPEQITDYLCQLCYLFFHTYMHM